MFDSIKPSTRCVMKHVTYLHPRIRHHNAQLQKSCKSPDRLLTEIFSTHLFWRTTAYKHPFYLLPTGNLTVFRNINY
jgi:hypothetical protein